MRLSEERVLNSTYTLFLEIERTIQYNLMAGMVYVRWPSGIFGKVIIIIYLFYL